MKIALINEIHTAGATRCAKDLERYLSARHIVRYYPEGEKETTASLLKKLAEFAPDVVHCHSYYGDLPYNFLSTISHLYPTCFTPHDPRPIGAPHPSFVICWACQHARFCFRCPLVSRYRKLFLLNPYFWRRSFKRYVHWRTAKTLHIIAPGEWLYHRLQYSELRHFSIQCISNGTDIERFYPISEARAQLGLSPRARILLYVAHPISGWNIDERKGLKFLAEAFVSTISVVYPDALLLVAGEKLVPNHPQVKPLGLLSQDQLPLYYSAADVFVMPTLADSFTYTVREAMACGTPVVASDIGGMSEGIMNGVTGVLVPPADSSALGQALVNILQDRTCCQEMGQYCRQLITERFNMEQFIRQHEELYYRMINPLAQKLSA